MQVNRLFLGLFVCVSMCACSNDDPEPTSGGVPEVFEGDEAYISVLLSDAGSMTRATTAGGYELGTADEHAVKNAYFYFYDADGVYVSQGSAWNGEADGSSYESGANIEFNGKNVVVLKGLTKLNYPKYMVTVLNKPDSFTPGSTLDEMEVALADAASAGITVYDDTDKKNYFVMSTTSWAGQGLKKYFVTEVKTSNFFTASSDVTENPDNYVQVYVERLAAKVTLKMNSNLATKEINGKKCYEITTTLAGAGNDDNVGVPDGSQTATEKLYVELLGWELNGTAKRSNIVKNIDEAWDNTGSGTLGFVWNSNGDHRSFWGKSFNYGKTTEYAYPATGVNYNAGDETCPLDYFNLNGALLEVDKDAYCAENTNTSEIVTANFPNALTSILLKAKICDAEGNALDLVRFNGVLFKKDSFLDYVLNVMKAKNNLNVWVEKTASTGTAYAQIDKGYVKLDNAGDGKVTVKMDVPSGSKVYARSGSEGSYTYTEITDFTAVNTALGTESAGAVGYDGGLMYYNIPIEHLNPSTATEPIPEAKYGVVRNHHYVVTVNELENVGKGIYDPTEVIVPGNPDDGKVYYVRATIDILSWKIVNQSVKL